MSELLIYFTIYLEIGAIFFLYNSFVDLKDITDVEQKDDPGEIVDLRRALYDIERVVGLKFTLLFFVFLVLITNLLYFILWPKSVYILIKGSK